MKKTKNSRIIAAIAMLVVSATALTTSSFAWFTMNKEVSATGLTLTASTPGNLQISKTSATADFADTVTLVGPAVKFTPVSGPTYVAATDPITTAPTLFYTEKSAVDGVVSADAGIVDDKTVFKPVTVAADKARQYYLDIPLWIKSDALDANTTIDVAVKSLTITDSNNKTISGAYRVAVLEKKLIYANALAETAWKPLATAKTIATTEVKAVKTGTVAIIPTAGTAQPVTLRIWLEGQDAACITTNAGASVSVGIVFEGTDKVA